MGRVGGRGDVAPQIDQNDLPRPDRPPIRRLDEEIGGVFRARAANLNRLDGLKRRGYGGASEMAAMADYLFAFAACACAVDDHHIDPVYVAYLMDEPTPGFTDNANPAASRAMAERIAAAVERGMARRRLNTASRLFEELARGRR